MCKQMLYSRRSRLAHIRPRAKLSEPYMRILTVSLLRPYERQDLFTQRMRYTRCNCGGGRMCVYCGVNTTADHFAKVIGGMHARTVRLFLPRFTSITLNFTIPNNDESSITTIAGGRSTFLGALWRSNLIYSTQPLKMERTLF